MHELIIKRADNRQTVAFLTIRSTNVFLGIIKSITEKYGLEPIRSRNEGVEVYGNCAYNFILVARTVDSPTDDFLVSAGKYFGWKP
jgi:hypothetical protein